MFRRLPLFIALALLLPAASAWAQDDEEIDEATGRRIIYKSKTEIDFEGIEVAGELVKPQGVLLNERKRASFNPLIKLRADFNEEMDESVDQIK